MKAPWQRVAALLLVIAASGCGAAAAQERHAVFEHGVLEWIRFRDAKEERERYSWTTAAEQIERDTAAGFFGALGVTATLQRSSADRVRVLDHLAAGGWLLVNRTDVAHADAGGTAIAERYVLRRRR
jgi:hypothetical protein